MRTAVSRLRVVGLGLGFGLGLVSRPGLAGPPESSGGSQATAAATPAPKDAPPTAGTAKATNSPSDSAGAKSTPDAKSPAEPARVYFRNGQPYDARLIQAEREHTCWTTPAKAKQCKPLPDKGRRCTLLPPLHYWGGNREPSGAYDVAQEQQRAAEILRRTLVVPECQCTCGAINAKPVIIDQIPPSNVP